MFIFSTRETLVKILTKKKQTKASSDYAKKNLFYIAGNLNVDSKYNKQSRVSSNYAGKTLLPVINQTATKRFLY